VDGYHYWVARLNPADASARGIQQHDLIKLHNDRGAVICAAMITNRVSAGIVHSFESSAVYDPIGEPGYSVDRGGAINLLSSSRSQIRKAHSMGASCCQIDVEKWTPPPSARAADQDVSREPVNA
jgi:anaerobic selenocysteine-containing dehydrogenase